MRPAPSGGSSVEVREARPDEVRDIRRVARITWHHTYRDSVPEPVRTEFVRRAYSDESLARRIENDVFLVAVRDGEILGFADFRTIPDGEVELAAIYVPPEAQDRGVGSRLLEAGMERFPRAARFVLRVEKDNANARRFYEARGFRATGEFTEAYLGHEFHEVEMVLAAGT